MNREKFEVPYRNTKLVGDVIGEKPKLLILHGAGTATRARYDYLRGLLINNGISSAIFDFLGHGDSLGEINQSSLESRTEQAKLVLESLKMDEINILGSSMGAYNAIKLTEIFSVENLILTVPAVYNPNAYKLPFGPLFSQAIRFKRIETDAWDILSKFKGGLLVFQAGKDDVIPTEIPQKIYDSVTTQNREIIQLPEATHFINQYLETHPADLEIVVNKIVKLLK